ncbi:MAG: type 1 glutamine amidotransferase [Actinomycetales bacterium]|nr:type 1 glutamine amidotransferase [Actinomycetales bacterium]
MTRRRALVLRHHLEDRPGLVGDALMARGFDLDVKLFGQASPTPSLEGVDLVVILGSSSAVYDRDVERAWFARELALIERADRLGISVFGICFGAQALCRSFGGVVKPGDSPEIGWYRVVPTADSPIVPGPWFEYHFDVCTLPVAATTWATTSHCVQAFAIGRHVGVQFHPELDAAQLSDWFGAGGDDARTLGYDPTALIEQTRREESGARERAVALVDVVIAHAAAFGPNATTESAT